MAFLGVDRTVQLHAKFGFYYRTRFPRAGRSLAYLPSSADLIVVSSSSDIYRCALLLLIRVCPCHSSVSPPLAITGDLAPDRRRCHL